MIEHLVNALRTAGGDPDWRDLADALWLAQIIEPTGQSTMDKEPVAPHADRSGATGEVEPASRNPKIPEADGGAARARVWPQLYGAATPDQTVTLEMRPPPWVALPGRLRIGRALRPLKQRRLSSREEVVDIEATVNRYCDTTLLVPVLVPARQSWFSEVALVVDGAPSMVVWRETVAALADLLSQYDAFERVTQWTLTGDRENVHLLSSTGLRHDPQELVDYGGRRLTLTITDCVADLWHGPAAWEVLRRWGRYGPCALVQTLPPRLWSATALGDADVAMTGQRRGGPNRALHLRPPWWWDEDQPPEDGIPVVNLDEHSLAAWARMLMGAGGVEVAGVLTQPMPLASSSPAIAPLDAQTRVAVFRSTVSTQAFRLATLLSAVEVSLPAARLVLNALIPDARQTHLAEVLASGLLQDNGKETFDFVPGVRELLQESLTTTATIDVWRAVAPYLEASTGRRPPFSMLLTSATPAEFDAEESTLGAIATALIDRLGMRPRTPSMGHIGQALEYDAPHPITPTGRLKFIGIVMEHYNEKVYHPLPGITRDVSRLAEAFADLGAATEVMASPTREELMYRLGTAVRGSDRVVVYWAGHSVARSASDLRLVLSDTSSLALNSEVYRPAKLIEEAFADGVSQVLLFLDLCHSGEDEAIRTAIRTPSLRSGDPRWVGMVVTSRPDEQRYDGQMAERLATIMREGPSDATSRHRWSPNEAMIRGVDLIEAIQGETPWSMATAHDGVSKPMLPNPLCNPSRVPAELVLAARGIAPGEDGWYFTGRRRALGEIVKWMRTNRPGVFIIGGPPGVGKSAVLGRIACLADPAERVTLVANGNAETGASDPGQGTVDAVVLAAGHSADSLLSELARTLGAPTTKLSSGLLHHLAQSRRPPVIVIDALDQLNPGQRRRVITDLLVPLSQQAQFLISSRDGMTSLTPLKPSRVINLATEKDTTDDIVRYVISRLGRNDDRTVQVASATAVRARDRGGFGYAQKVTTLLRNQPELSIPVEDWLEQLDLPRGPEQEVGQRVSASPASEFSFSLEAGVFIDAAVKLLRADEDIPIRRLLGRAASDARSPYRAGDAQALDQILDRLTCLAALFLELERRDWFHRAVDALVAVYSIGFENEPEIVSDPPPAAASLWLAIARRVEALGGLAVRRADWSSVAYIAVQKAPGMHRIYATWFKHATTMANRTEAAANPSVEHREVSIVSLARETVRQLECVRPDLEAGDERILASLTQFDFLVCIVAIAQTNATDIAGVFYPHFATFYSTRTQPIVERLIADQALRQRVYPHDDAHLAQALILLDRYARKVGANYDGWEGYSQPINDFIARHAPSASEDDHTAA